MTVRNQRSAVHRPVGVGTSTPEVQLMMRPEFRTDPLITDEFDFEDLHDAMATFENRKTARSRSSVTI